MKITTITCDGCGRDITDKDHITIGSENNTLHFNRGQRFLSKFHDLHFCDQEHFVECFFPNPISRKV